MKIRRTGWAAFLLAVLLALPGCSEAGPETASVVFETTAAAEETTAAGTETAAEPVPESTPEQTQAEEDDGWKLLLVNAEHPLPEGYTFTFKELRNGHRVDERIYPELQQMFDDAREAGIYPYVNESFRTAEQQQDILDSYIARYEESGLDHDEAVKKAREVVALPGTSEHQLGLALDIISEFDADHDATWQWLAENCWRYGFILRYPADKTEITGISYEPWHFRYVGKDAAKEITEQGVCLEEYLGQQ